MTLSFGEALVYSIENLVHVVDKRAGLLSEDQQVAKESRLDTAISHMSQELVMFRCVTPRRPAQSPLLRVVRPFPRIREARPFLFLVDYLLILIPPERLMPQHQHRQPNKHYESDKQVDDDVLYRGKLPPFDNQGVQ